MRKELLKGQSIRWRGGQKVIEGELLKLGNVQKVRGSKE